MSYNPNTKYGRRKTRSDFQKRYNNMSKKEKESFDFEVAVGRLILFIIAAIIIITCGYFGIKVK